MLILSRPPKEDYANLPKEAYEAVGVAALGLLEESCRVIYADNYVSVCVEFKDGRRKTITVPVLILGISGQNKSWPQNNLIELAGQMIGNLVKDTP